jgi:hypothetical protein
VESKFVVCMKNEGYAVSLEVRKVYMRISDPDAARHGQIRVVDESGEDYLYPEKYFAPVELPTEAERSLSGSP